MNPKAIGVMWLLSVLMAGSISLGPYCVLFVAVLSVAYVGWSVLS